MLKFARIDIPPILQSTNIAYWLSCFLGQTRQAGPCHRQPELEGGEAGGVDSLLGHIVQHGGCPREEDREVREPGNRDQGQRLQVLSNSGDFVKT